MYIEKKKKKPKKLIGLVIVLFLVLIGLIILTFYNNISNNFNQNYSSKYSTAKADQKLKDGKPVSVLLMGTDTGALGRTDVGRTDSMIVATINPQTNKTTFTSIPRDSKVKVDGDSQPYEKINAAYEIGGSEQAKKTVSELLNVPIDYYATVNMSGIKEMVNAVGGIDVTPKLTFDYEGISVKKGVKQHMNGETALQYSRMRYQDPEGDYGRQARQRQVLEQILMKSVKISSVSHFQNILNSLHGNLLTDLSFNDLILLGDKYRPALRNFNENHLQGVGADVDGISYQVIENDELLKVSNDIKSELGLPSENSLNNVQKKINSNSSTNDYDE